MYVPVLETCAFRRGPTWGFRGQTLSVYPVTFSLNFIFLQQQRTAYGMCSLPLSSMSRRASILQSIASLKAKVPWKVIYNKNRPESSLLCNRPLYLLNLDPILNKIKGIVISWWRSKWRSRILLRMRNNSVLKRSWYILITRFHRRYHFARRNFLLYPNSVRKIVIRPIYQTPNRSLLRRIEASAMYASSLSEIVDEV